MITLTVFSILASLLIVEDWYSMQRQYWREESRLLHLGMAVSALVIVWVVALLVAFLVSAVFR
jgi:hypothetical protein